MQDACHVAMVTKKKEKADVRCYLTISRSSETELLARMLAVLLLRHEKTLVQLGRRAGLGSLYHTISRVIEVGSLRTNHAAEIIRPERFKP